MEKRVKAKTLMIIDLNGSRVYEFPYYQVGDDFDIVEGLNTIEKFYGYSFSENDIHWVLTEKPITIKVSKKSKTFNFLGVDIEIGITDTIMDLILKFADQDYIVMVNSRGEIYYEDNSDRYFVGRVAFDELVFHRLDIIEKLQEVING